MKAALQNNCARAYKLPMSWPESRFISSLSETFSLAKDAAVKKKIVFFDTFDWRLFNKGLTLQQSGHDWTLCRLLDDECMYQTSVSRKPTFHHQFPAGTFQDKLSSIIDVRALLRLFQVSSRTQSVRILDDNQKTVAVLQCRQLRPFRNSGVDKSFYYVNLAPILGYDDNLKEIRAWFDKVGVDRVAIDYFREILTAMGNPPGRYSSKRPVDLDARMSSLAATHVILHNLLDVINDNYQGVIDDIDTEFLHDFRVAIRRTRAALSQMKAVFPEQKAAAFKSRFASLQKTTNRLRDLDVYLRDADHYRDMLPQSLKPEIDPLFDHLREARKEEHRRVSRELKSDSYRRLIAAWERFIDEGKAGNAAMADAAKPIVDFARERISVRFCRVIKLGRQIDDASADACFHELRIECKKLRYLMEFFSSVFPKNQIEKLIAQLKILQDNLGRFQDFSVQEEDLRRFVGEIPRTRQANQTILAVGCLIGKLDAEKNRVRTAFHDVFENFASATNKLRFQELFE